MAPNRRIILVIDDDEVTRQVLSLLLENAGWEPYTAESGGAALDLLPTLRSQPEIVLSDLQMPGLSSEELVRSFRSALPQTTKILAMSATQRVSRAKDIFDGFLLKPFTAEDLTAALEVDGARQVNASTGDLNEIVWQKLMSSMPRPQVFALYEFALQDAATRVETMRTALSQKDYATLRAQAHALKGSAGMIGADTLRSLAAAIDDTPLTAAIPVPVEGHLTNLLSGICRLRSILLERSLT